MSVPRRDHAREGLSIGTVARTRRIAALLPRARLDVVLLTLGAAALVVVPGLSTRIVVP